MIIITNRDINQLERRIKALEDKVETIGRLTTRLNDLIVRVVDQFTDVNDVAAMLVESKCAHYDKRIKETERGVTTSYEAAVNAIGNIKDIKVVLRNHSELIMMLMPEEHKANIKFNHKSGLWENANTDRD